MEGCCSTQAVHHTWKAPEAWSPERFMPGGEYDCFDEDVRAYQVHLPHLPPSPPVWRMASAASAQPCTPCMEQNWARTTTRTNGLYQLLQLENGVHLPIVCSRAGAAIGAYKVSLPAA